MSIKAENLNYIYNEGTSFEVYALKNVSFSINDGEFIGIIGHTGSGKSTLIQHLNGLLKANSGKLYFNGEDVYEKGYDLKKLRQKVGLVFQYPEHQLFEVDVLSDVCFGPINQGLTREEAEKKAIEALKMTGIDESLYKHSPFELSGGQKRRVAIAGVLAMNPEVLVLDEPTAGLDPYGRDEILDKISELREQTGMSIVLVSHSMEDIAKYVSRLMVMSGGEKIFDDTPKEVFKHYKELEKIGLAAPQITYVIQRLRAEGVDISDDITTVEEAKEAILKIYNSQKEQI
jgi:ABC transporter related protein